VNGTVSVWTDAQNKSTILEVQAKQTEENIVAFETDIKEFCSSPSVTALCTPEIHFASVGQFLCDPESRYYSKDSVLCQASFPTVIVLAGLKSCATTIDRVDFTLTLPDQSTVLSSTDETWPYTVFSQDPDNSAQLTSGVYFLNYTIHGNLESCLSWSGTFAFEVDGTNSCSVTEDQPFLYNGHLYAIGPNLDWYQSQALANSQICCNKVGHLVTITDIPENDFVYSVLERSLPYKSDFWIGATDLANEGIFSWVTNESWSYESWEAGEPNNGYYDNVFYGEEDCAYMRSETGEWADNPCDYVAEEDYSLFEWDCA
jgi:Lectin C-type domain